MKIRPALLADMPAVRAMLAEYVEWIGLDLAFQEIDEELNSLPGAYVPPRGVLLVAEEKGQLAGMVALRPLDNDAGVANGRHDGAAEMKRLFVRPQARGRGLAKLLIAELLREARAIGYAEIRLDTLPMMGDAQSLYVALGFRDIPAYYDTPIPGTRFMAIQLVSGPPETP